MLLVRKTVLNRSSKSVLRPASRCISSGYVATSPAVGHQCNGSGPAGRKTRSRNTSHLASASSCRLVMEKQQQGRNGLRTNAMKLTIACSFSSMSAAALIPDPPDTSSLGSSSSSSASQPNSGGKTLPFLLADIGEGIAEVELMQWFVREGDIVKQFDRICEVQSDKATVEISSRYDGVVKIVHHPVGSIVKVGCPLVDIQLPDNNTAAAPVMNNTGPPPSTSTNTSPLPSLLSPNGESQNKQQLATYPPLSIPPAGGGGSISTPIRGEDEVVPTTPAVRRIAREYGIDLALVRPTGPQGRVLKGDVLEYIRVQGVTGASHSFPSVSGPHLNGPTSTSNSPSLPSAAAAAAPSYLPTPSPHQQQQQPSHNHPASTYIPVVLPVEPSPLSATVLNEPKRVAVRGVMRQMIKIMNASMKIPHFNYQDEVIVDKMIELRQALKPIAEAQGIKFSFLPIMIKAASLALLQYPLLNASLTADEKEVIYHPDHHIGVAMDTPKGLLVPALRKVQEKSILQLAKELTELQSLAATNCFGEEHLTGATFSLSNIGSIGGTYASPRIVPPQVAIGALGKIQTLPRFAEDGTTVIPTRVMNISWSGDHRVIDGATIAKFSNLWKAYLEEPASMLAETR